MKVCANHATSNFEIRVHTHTHTLEHLLNYDVFTWIQLNWIFSERRGGNMRHHSGQIFMWKSLVQKLNRRIWWNIVKIVCHVCQIVERHFSNCSTWLVYRNFCIVVNALSEVCTLRSLNYILIYFKFMWLLIFYVCANTFDQYVYVCVSVRPSVRLFSSMRVFILFVVVIYFLLPCLLYVASLFWDTFIASM